MKKLLLYFTLIFVFSWGWGQKEINPELLTVNNAPVIINNKAVSINSEWVFQTAASETQLVINTLNIASGGKVTVDWGDKTKNTYTGNNTNITHDYSVAGQYTVKIQFHDFSKITGLRLFNINIIDDISNVNFGNLVNLQSLWLYDNNLEGVIPPEISNLVELENLWLGDNNLEGTIPPEIGNLVNLQSLWLYDNNLEGVIPPEISNLVELENLWLYDNNLEGVIPPEISNLVELVRLNLHLNNLEGVIPPEIGNLVELENLILHLNDLEGVIPDLSNNKKITVARFQDNQFTGIDSIYIPNDATEWRFDGNQFSSTEVNEVLEDANASITAPTENLTINLSGASMGALPNGASNVHLTALTAKYTAESKTLTVVYNSP